ncbi:MAG TPA: hypothetical protein VIW26_05080 [Gemmatimonadales bacterium]|jgi:hypothetical protein
MLIDRCLRCFDVTLACETTIRALPSEVYEAMLGTDLRDPLVNALFALREMPLRIARRLHREPPPPAAPAVTFGDIAKGPIWVRLAEEPGVELVVGSIGRFWQKDYGWQPIAADRFEAFQEPGYAKVVLSLAVLPSLAGLTLLRYEARTATTDAMAARRFRRYWRLIRPGVALVMRRALRRIKEQAERCAGVAAA